MRSWNRNPRLSLVPFILTINLGIFILWQMPHLAPRIFMFENFLVSWQAISEGRPWTLLTATFSHNALWHFFINMFVLYSFGRVVEVVLGSRSFLNFYLLAAVISSFCHAAVSAHLLNQPALPALGASGAVAGVILLFALLFPRDKILLMGIIPIPAFVGALAFIAFDIWGLFSQVRGTGLPIGHGAHLGGATVGIIYYFLVLRGRAGRR